LGYPLEKAAEILESTKGMMTAFITNPVISMDLSFNGVQNNMNDFILRLMSSKMDSRDIDYVARLQPKYYFKFQKSLEHSKHGIISAIIIYKLLLYFMESDFSINEDYLFNKEEARQFYIRREILRAIASHTCSDVYQMNQARFSFLLISCDEAQTWGRKGISELYINKNTQYEYKDLIADVRNGEWRIMDSYKVKDKMDAKNILESFKHQCQNYISVFRDGQDTTKRDFDFKWIMSIQVNLSNFDVIFSAKRDESIKISLEGLPERALSESNDTVIYFDKLFENSSLLSKGANRHEWSFSKAKI
jgi:hypothetical protein